MTASASGEKPGDHIGNYKILQQIGEGGCGVVYMAEQARPVRRRVALKVIKACLAERDKVKKVEISSIFLLTSPIFFFSVEMSSGVAAC